MNIQVMRDDGTPITVNLDDILAYEGVKTRLILRGGHEVVIRQSPITLARLIEDSSRPTRTWNLNAEAPFFSLN